MDVTFTMDEPDALFVCFSMHANSPQKNTNKNTRKGQLQKVKEGNNALYNDIKRTIVMWWVVEQLHISIPQ